MNLLLWMLHVTEQHYPVIGALRVGGEHAADAGITLGIEALNRFECYLVNTMADACDRERRERVAARSHLRERPRHAQQRPGGVEGDVHGSQERRP